MKVKTFNIEFGDHPSIDHIQDFIMGEVVDYFFSNNMVHLILAHPRTGNRQISINTKHVDFITAKWVKDEDKT